MKKSVMETDAQYAARVAAHCRNTAVPSGGLMLDAQSGVVFVMADKTREGVVLLETRVTAIPCDAFAQFCANFLSAYAATGTFGRLAAAEVAPNVLDKRVQ